MPQFNDADLVDTILNSSVIAGRLISQEPRRHGTISDPPTLTKRQGRFAMVLEVLMPVGIVVGFVFWLYLVSVWVTAL